MRVERSYLGQMHNGPELHSLYAFLPPRGPDKGNTNNAWEIGANIVGGVQQLAEIIATKEIIVDESPWTARLITKEESGTNTHIEDNAQRIANAYQNEPTSKARRAAMFDRPLTHSSIGATRQRLEVVMPPEAQPDQYCYTVTAYTPRTVAPEAPSLFDEAEYRQILALQASGDMQALQDFLDQSVTTSPAASHQLPVIAFQDIHSQFRFRWLKNTEQAASDVPSLTPYIQTIRFQPGHADAQLGRLAIPINGDIHRLEEAYTGDHRPTLRPNQEMIRASRGVVPLIHHDLSIVLRHLVHH